MNRRVPPLDLLVRLRAGTTAPITDDRGRPLPGSVAALQRPDAFNRFFVDRLLPETAEAA